MDKSEFLGVTTDTWDAITALATAGTLLIAAVAAGVAAIQLFQTREARLEQNRPYIVVTFEQSPVDVTFVDIVIRNVGAGPARGVTIRVDPPLARSVTMPIPDIDEAPYFKETIPIMPPGYELRMFYDSMVDRRERDDLPHRPFMMVSMATTPGVPRALSRKQAAEAYSISVFTVDELIASGQVRAKRLGRRILVDAASMQQWFESLDDA